MRVTFYPAYSYGVGRLVLIELTEGELEHVRNDVPVELNTEDGTRLSIKRYSDEAPEAG